MSAIRTGFCRRIAMTMRATAAIWALACASVSPAVAADVGQVANHGASGADASADAGFVARIAGQLASNRAVRAHFRQTQTLAALSAPLVSTGTLVFIQERGVIWRLDTPVRVTYVIGDTSVTKIDASGHRTTTGASRGGMAQVPQMMRAMLSGDLSGLYSRFDVAGSGTAAHWQLILTPNQPQLAQFVKALRMDGGAFLQALEIDAANGDTTRIEFSGSESIDPHAFAESGLFEAR
jgi:hypothetical protein